MKAFLSFLTNNTNKTDLGLLVVRLGIGLSMALFHGWGKISSPERWAAYGANMKMFGLDFFPEFWGFMAGFAEFGCSILIILGLFHRPATAMLAFTMLVAATRHISLPEDSPNSGFSGASHALEMLTVYVALFLSGPGKFSLMPGKKEE
ncbi:MAG: DoxX family protein [Candidatus Latescibacteria bacterium]|jgi:putative oxidoreductase|nr:DoxX family protein [Candidatus Latescibacterota bacterium]MDP7237381.1 DoxX family protein [Candidatus Latescibacterota bacterium]MDP7416490.1 DoxX family protein [Desulfobacterales bacterium]